MKNRIRYSLAVALLVLLPAGGIALAVLDTPADRQDPRRWLQENYAKQEVMIPMRDGVSLFTSIYSPRRMTGESSYPILMRRTPYSCSPYGADEYPYSIGPNPDYARDGYIIIYQDVRGCWMSEGEFVNMTPHVADKQGREDIDESTDTWDTIEWLINNLDGHNGRVGLWGISYPGFYAAASMIDAHPALKAVSPQAPIADWWYDDFHHHGAFFLAHAYGFERGFGQARPEPTTERKPPVTDFWTPDGYAYYMDLGPLKNADERYFKGRIAFWNAMMDHPNYDAFWQARNILPHLHDVAPAVMTVGGWFDAEDLYGPLNIYRSIEEKNPGITNFLVMGPWPHGGWARGTGERLGNVPFAGEPSVYYQQNIEWPFFNYYLKDRGEPNFPEAWVYETGADQWHTFPDWPPSQAEAGTFYLHSDGALAADLPARSTEGYAEFISDPDKPVPFTEEIATGMTRPYMTDDQRFAARRPDVLVYQTPVLEADVTLAGPVIADLWVSTSVTDADWVVKLIDVYPLEAEDWPDLPPGRHTGGYQMMVRSEVIRGRFRNDPARPEPFEPGVPTRVRLPLQDILHTFRAGHRIMIQVQSTWFPLVDCNPQTFVENIYYADEADFRTATHRVYCTAPHASRIEVGVMPAGWKR